MPSVIRVRRRPAESSQNFSLQLLFSAPLQTSFLQDHDVSIVNITNLVTQPYNKDDQYIRAFMSEIVSVFKDIAQLNPLFRDQITNFSINQVASNFFYDPHKLASFAAPSSPD